MFYNKKLVSGFPLDEAIYAHPLIPKQDKSDTATPPSYRKQDFATMHQRSKSTANCIDCVQHSKDCKHSCLGAGW